MYDEATTGQQWIPVAERLGCAPSSYGARLSDTPSLDFYVSKLESRTALPDDARAALLATPTLIDHFPAYRDVMRQGDRPTRCCVVASGMVSRFRALRSGVRQILSFHLAGDMIDLPSALVIVADHGIRTHTATTLVTIAHGDVLRLAADYPALGRAFWFDTLIDAAIFREWTVNIGRRNARERTAHLLLELATKNRAAGLMPGDSFELPVSQADLADALGMTAVHLNRTLQWMRRERMIRTLSKSMTIENWPALTSLAGFDPLYLCPEGPRVIP